MICRACTYFALVFLHFMHSFHILDVAGLIPGASEGLGLGNKFLDDLRTATVLLHVISLVLASTSASGDWLKLNQTFLKFKWCIVW